ncbi:MAG: UDP-3-O-(3-hydroxymyristoyl)glucosamine N-acyltransferase [Leptospiraceae bacterium]|nr:UDP-3-O-(3-hydroxymyristoyl)glucosamine N-acyltransferase [Leptospiraceae bacterium]
MNSKASEIFALFNPAGILESLEGDAFIAAIHPVETGKSGSLVFIDNKKFLPFVKENKPSAVVTNKDLLSEIQSLGLEAVFLAKNVGVAHAALKQKYADRDLFQSEWGKRHSSALIHETAKVPESCMIAPNVVIGENAVIGERCVIQTGAVIEANAKLGDDCVIFHNSVIGYNCILGNRVFIKTGTVIGSEGFGFAQGADKRYHRIPQTGIVVLEDDVHVGANCCIDRAAYLETRVKRGTKFDNLCHVAHNVEIGEDCALTAGFIVAGSTKLGNRIITSGQCGILDHLTIVDDVVLLMRPGASNDVKEPGLYAGTPLQPFGEYTKSLAVYRKLPDLRARVNDLEKSLKALKSDN